MPDSWKNPRQFYRTNVLGTIHVLEFCRRFSLPLTFASSYIYGQPDKLPTSEDDPIKPNNPYTHSKEMAEQACRFYSDVYSLKTAIIRPFNAYGSGQDERFLIPKIINQALTSSEIRLGSLSTRRDFVYVDDIVDAMLLTINATSKLAVYNVGSGRSLALKEVVNTVQQALGD